MTDNEIECPDCDGFGWLDRRGWTDVHGDCKPCKGTGWRPETQEEANDRAADAFSDMCEGEPPIGFFERVEMNAKRDGQWGLK